MTAPKKMAKRAAAGTLALAICFTGGVIGAGAASAAPGFKFDQRISGTDRVGTSVAAAEAGFADGSDTVIIVERDAVVDGLTASYAAGLNKAPILYVDTKGVPDQVAAEIKKLGATKAILVGGTARLPKAVEDQLKSSGLTVTRQSGPDRYSTAAAVALSGSRTPDKVLVASGETPADALAAGPVAYAKNYPLVLVRPDSVPDSSRDALDKLGSGERLAIGGTVRISAGVYDSLGQVKRRVSGANRQLTAIEIAKIATGELGFQKDRVALVSNADRAAVDALVASPVAGKNLAPLLFTSGNDIGNDTQKYLQDNAAALTGPGYVFGGTAAVPQSAADQGTTAAGGDAVAPPSSIGFNVTPNDAKTLVFVATGDEVTNDTSDDRTFGVDGLNNDLSYNITLVKTENINIAADGKVTFKSSADPASKSGFSADTGEPATTISVVNGSPLGGSLNKSAAKPVGGKLSFSIEGQASESVIPVVYVTGGPGKDADNGGPSGRLETQATKAGEFGEGAEKYGLGGVTTYVPIEATAGDIGGAKTITTVNKAAGYVIAGGKTYFYDGNDQYRIGTAPVTQAKFIESLSKGDTIDGTYADDADLQSTFTLDDLTPSVVQGVNAVPVDDTSVKITWTTPNPVPNSYSVYRKLGTTETATLADYTKVIDLPGTTSPTTFTDKGLTADTDYTYAITQTVDGDESALGTVVTADSPSAATAKTAAPGVTAAPQSVNAGVTNDDSFAGTVSPGDVYTIAFNRPINVPAGSTVIRIQDANGESVDLSTSTAGGATATTFTRNANPVDFEGKRYEANTVLTITAGSGVIVDRDGNTSNNNGSVDYPATIVAQNGGITANVNGTNTVWNPATSTDNVLQTGAAAPTAATGDTTAPAVTATPPASGATTVVFTANEALDPTSVVNGDFTSTGGAVSNVALTNGNTTITVTVATPLTQGQTVTLGANNVKDVAGNNGPATAVVATTTA